MKKITKTLIVLILMAFTHDVLAQQVKKKVVAAKTKSEKMSKSLNGKVVDEATGKPVSGASITYGEVSADISDDKGSFSLQLPSLDLDIKISAEGYEPRQISLKGASSVIVKLVDDNGQSFQKNAILQHDAVPRRNLTAAVSTFSPNGNWSRPMESIDELLQGQVAGLQSIRRSGSLNKGANLFLRGFNSLYGTNAPLIVVDGILYDANDYGNSIIRNNYTNPLALINPQDIDEVSVIKDAASEYGTKGANGVIVITTSRAKKQATSIDFGIYGSYNQKPKELQMMDASSYRVYLNEMLLSKGLSTTQVASMPFMMDDASKNNQYYRYHNNTNWQDEVLQNSFNKNYFLKVTGGDNIATYALSIGFAQKSGIVKQNDLTNFNTRFNAAFNFSKNLTGEANLGFTSSEQDLRSQGMDYKISPLFTSLIKSPLMAPHQFNSLGVVSPNLEDADVLGISNPTSLIEKAMGKSKVYGFTGSYKFKYDFSKSLKASALIGVLFNKVREDFFIPRWGVVDDTLVNAIAASRLGTQVRRLYTTFTEAKLEYDKTFNYYHRWSSKLGIRYQMNNAQQDYTLGYNSATDDLVSIQNGDNALRKVGGGIADWNWMNAFYNLQYGYKDRFFLNFSTALDGSSRFGQYTKTGVKIGNFNYAWMPSLGAAWLISSEPSFKNKNINLLKLRATLSKSGNDDIGNYTARQSYTSQNFLGMQGLVRTGIPNPAIQWESVAKANLGFDLAFLNDRVALSLDVYTSKTSNMLVMENLSTVTGFQSVLTNSGSMTNRGIELAANAIVVHNKNWSWSIGGTIATNRNRIVSLPGNSFITSVGNASVLTAVGSSVGVFYGYRTEGVFSTTAEALATGLRAKNADGSYSNFQGGDVSYQDANGDRVIDNKDFQVIGRSTPKYHGSFNTKLKYRKITLDALFTFVKGLDVFNQLRYQLESSNSVYNQLNSVVNRWRDEGQITNIPRASFGDPHGNNRFSDRYIEDGSYLKLRSLSLSYDLNINDKFLKNASVYVTGNNLLTFTKYMGYDPEFSLGNGVFYQGIDGGLDPLYKNVTLGVRFGL